VAAGMYLIPLKSMISGRRYVFDLEILAGKYFAL
jgi:hypothetical protein